MSRFFSLVTVIVALLATTCTATPKKPAATSLESSKWTDPATGNWVIALYPDGAIYQNRVWDYDLCDFASGRFRLVSPADTVSVIVGRESDGMRPFTIDGSFPVMLSRLTTSRNLSYPPVDSSFSLIDNGFAATDTVTIRGWLRNIPDRFLSIDPQMSLILFDILADDDITFTSPIDSLGRFQLQFPVPNTTEVRLDPHRMRFSFPVEPGETYFLLVDFPADDRLLMGNRTRLQNELLAFPPNQWWPDERKATTAEEIIRPLEAWYGKVCDDIDRTAASNPSLSPLWSEWSKDYCRAILGFYLGQSKFRTNFTLLPEVFDFARVNCWDAIPDNPLLSNPHILSSFVRDFTDDALDKSPLRFNIPVSFSRSVSVVCDIPAALLDSLKPIADDIRAKVEAARLTAVSDSVPADLVDRGHNLSRAVSNYNLIRPEGLRGGIVLDELSSLRAALDLIGASTLVRDICSARTLIQRLDGERIPLPDVVIDSIDALISSQWARDAVIAINDKYRAIAASSFRVTSDSIPDMIVHVGRLEGVTTGEEILARITEPYRGRFILIDVWGTWCGPCKRELSKFKEEREALDPYGVAYIFLANSSSEDSWRNVIAEYDITGPSISHYNLDQGQERVLENLLNVHSYPTYRLIAPDGSFIDINTYPLDVPALASLISSLTSPRH